MNSIKSSVKVLTCTLFMGNFIPMSELETKLERNALGRLLGKEFISLRQNILIDSKKGTWVISDDILECKNFAVLKNSLLGCVLTLKVGKKQIRYRFLKKRGSEEFLKILNQTIAYHINEYLRKTFNEFNTNVILEYPRDSRLEQLSRLCLSLKDHYNNQRDLWEKNLASNVIDEITKIVAFLPIQAEVLRDYHEKFQLEMRSSFFDQVESNPLTQEQRLGVLRSNDINMVLAAAGTGKTSVMVAKALDLIDRGLAKPTEILILAYNRSAAEELKDRLVEKAEKGNIKLESQPQISTFHALGRKLLRDAGVSTYISVFTEDDIKLKQWITSWLETYLLADESRFLDFIDLLTEPVNPFNFESVADYEKYVRDNEFRTLNGERVKGYQELLIANFLYSNGVDYAYEARYVSKRRIDIGFDYRPDFHINSTNIYIEHFGIARNGATRPGIDPSKYNESILNKRVLHAECETTLIETFHYEWIEQNLISGLKEKLAEQGVIFTPLKPEEILNKLRENGQIAQWSDLLKKAIQAIRVERLTQVTILERLRKAAISQPDKVTELLDALNQGYVQELNDQKAIDFDDMIIRAIKVIVDGDFVPPWKYILVDEFQDISAARMEFISSIIEHGPQPSLTVVGDDWQSIYRFSGGKLELTTRFGEMIGNFTSTKLQKTFRYNNSIANTAGKFVMENPEQYEKLIETHTKVQQSQVYLLDDKTGKKGGVYERVKDVVQKIKTNDARATIALIARYNYLINEAKDTLVQANLHSNVYFWTFHKSKGLEADYCILIGFSHGRNGFPNENKDDAIIEALLPSLDSFPHSEERRLLYVGLTRTRKKTYIIADPTAPSDFITELLSPKYELNIVSAAFKEQYRIIFKCPSCVHGYLKLINGKYGEFYACSTGAGCLIRKARVCIKCGAPAVDGRNESICNNVSCRNIMKICERCGRPMKLREGKFGQFWGCTGYGIKDDQCKQTSKLKLMMTPVLN